MARRGNRVLLINPQPEDNNLRSLFGGVSIPRPLQDVLRGACAPEEGLTDLSAAIAIMGEGKLWYAQAPLETMPLHDLSDVIEQLIDHLNLDFVVIDGPPGLERRGLALLALSELLVVVLALDAEDYQGTAVLIDVARRIEIPEIVAAINLVTEEYDREVLRTEVEGNYGCPVGAIIPKEEEILPLGLIAVRLPGHPVSNAINSLVNVIVRP